MKRNNREREDSQRSKRSSLGIRARLVALILRTAIFSLLAVLFLQACLTQEQGLCVEDPTDDRCICGQVCEGATPICDHETKQCVAASDAEPCQNNEDCEGELVCNEASGRCVEQVVQTDCSEDSDCMNAAYPACVNEQCRECSVENDSACGEKEKCDVVTSRCVANTCADLNDVCGMGDFEDRPHCDDASIRCVACLENSHCAEEPGTPFCSPQNHCVSECEADASCRADEKCNLDSGLCERKTCADFVEVCGADDFEDRPYCKSESLSCVACLEDAHCPADGQDPALSRCDLSLNVCVACEENNDCGFDAPRCQAGVCVACLSEEEAPGEEVLSGCEHVHGKGVCKEGADPETLWCLGNVCRRLDCGQTCTDLGGDCRNADNTCIP